LGDETYRRIVGGDKKLVRADNVYMAQLDALGVRKGEERGRG